MNRNRVFNALMIRIFDYCPSKMRSVTDNHSLMLENENWRSTKKVSCSVYSMITREMGRQKLKIFFESDMRAGEDLLPGLYDNLVLDVTSDDVTKIYRSKEDSQVFLQGSRVCVYPASKIADLYFCEGTLQFELPGNDI